MKDPQSHDVTEIESLLATRQQLSDWLERLERTGAKTPESVRAKVRADYLGRLGQVVAQLSTHRDVIGSTLDGLRAQSEEFGQLRREELEVRAEAELRHEVGEYSDDEWQLVELESSGKISSFDQEIGRLSDEIRRLAEVQALINPEAEQRPAPDPAPERRSVTLSPKLVTEETPVPPPSPQPRPEAPRFVPRGGGGPRESSRPHPRVAPVQAQPSHSGQDDELAFLRSMNVEIEPPARPARQPNGGNTIPSASAGADASSAVEGDQRAAPTSTKTLKCGECGSLNRPTEWYCERCGAELAAV